MADRALHNYLCMKILGKEHDSLNAFLDSPSRVVVGPNHRLLFHDEQTIARLSVFNVEAGIATLLHKILDENKDLENLLRVMAVMDGLSRKPP